MNGYHYGVICLHSTDMFLIGVNGNSRLLCALTPQSSLFYSHFILCNSRYSGHPDRQIISRALVRKMSVFRPLTNTWCRGCGYGLASFNLGYQNYRVIAAPDTLMGPSPESWFYVDRYGHIGQDWYVQPFFI